MNRSEYNKAYLKEYRKNKAKVRDNTLRHRYGISLAERNQILLAQGNCCAICRASSPGIRDWATDHDHKTGKIRGILCFRCNVVLGRLGDTIESTLKWVDQATQYLKEANGMEPCKPLSNRELSKV